MFVKQIAIYFLFVFCLCGSGSLLAQTLDSYDYDSEFTWGINKNSYGGLIGGFVFKKARRIDKKIFFQILLFNEFCKNAFSRG